MAFLSTFSILFFALIMLCTHNVRALLVRSFKTRTFPGPGLVSRRGNDAALPRTSALFLSSSTPPGIQNMNVVQFGDILQGNERNKYQIIDVRETDELKQSALSGDDIIHLPLSEAEQWSKKVLDGDLLDATKPTLVMCKMGGRSMKVSMFLTVQAGFPEVFNVDGGITSYAAQVDPSVIKE
eukprot:CAMPEP_0174957474 /NCGR_PEP_ID=MMETSP0004_2-20121128/2091_1 /TAXON_ID=420556 /ORGANISM="Ochromonas sp., Strain CCMP1393" /LENGTH=181 /DNA_ID=CAMNT_0016205585 /DNA_START=18 /DNA_END=563 /DNA_ORIENTATION=+